MLHTSFLDRPMAFHSQSMLLVFCCRQCCTMPAMVPLSQATTAIMLQILTMLDDNLAAAPDTLGDSRKETPEELAERHTRVQAASLLALSSLIDLTAGGESGVSGGHAVGLIWGGQAAVLPNQPDCGG